MYSGKIAVPPGGGGIADKSMDFGEQMFTKASQNSDISASCSEKIVTVAFYINVKSCRYFINRLALLETRFQRGASSWPN
jgi:hypothetical protein